MLRLPTGHRKTQPPWPLTALAAPEGRGRKPECITRDGDFEKATGARPLLALEDRPRAHNIDAWTCVTAYA